MLILNYIYMKFVTYGIPKKNRSSLKIVIRKIKTTTTTPLMMYLVWCSILLNFRRVHSSLVITRRNLRPTKNVLAIRAKTLSELARGGRRRRRGLFDSIDKIVVRIPDFDEKNSEILFRYVYTKELEQNPKSEGRCYGIIDGLQIDLV